MPIWAIFMHDVYDTLQLPLEDFQPPASGNIVTVKYCRESIFELGDPKLYSKDCRSGEYKDISNVKDLPEVYDAMRDTQVKIFDKYAVQDSSHEAKEIK